MNAINWQQPWLQPLRRLGEPLAQAVSFDKPLHAALNITAAGPVRFVSQSALPDGQAYEQFIFETGSVPTRDNLHDFFNGLVWIHFPKTKSRLNALQAAEIVRAGVQPLRGPVRDALTVFDENAAFLIAPPPLWDALAARDWQALFVTLRPLWREAQLVLFGHALLEKLVSPRKAITAHVYRTQAAINSIANAAQLDELVAASLTAGGLAGKPFLPLPVLGVPGWWVENESPSFYDDPAVFRPAAPRHGSA
ncbi:MAG: DUF3025 domain-containing protein [Polaromonas sp.]|nr:DUF3025 domain-containing protein [Polaromonas sp.]